MAYCFVIGEYAGFDENEPTSRSGGKALVVRRLKEHHGYQRLVIVGDGATDAEACPPADGFIGKLDLRTLIRIQF